MKALFAPLAMKVAGGIVVVLLILLAVQTFRLNSSEAARANLRAKLAETAAALQVQNAAVDSWKAEADTRAKLASEALKAARAVNERERPQIEKLRASAASPKGDKCEISETLRTTEGL
jgi:cell division protein FtsB